MKRENKFRRGRRHTRTRTQAANERFKVGGRRPPLDAIIDDTICTCTVHSAAGLAREP